MKKSNNNIKVPMCPTNTRNISNYVAGKCFSCAKPSITYTGKTTLNHCDGKSADLYQELRICVICGKSRNILSINQNKD
ncbi:MAG: hypothetical protein KAR06_01650 [Deltaproteobacteria bacterium]|nr:hypothetical protein [Deltaproteobacteria bacterium]